MIHSVSSEFSGSVQSERQCRDYIAAVLLNIARQHYYCFGIVFPLCKPAMDVAVNTTFGSPFCRDFTIIVLVCCVSELGFLVW